MIKTDEEYYKALEKFVHISNDVYYDTPEYEKAFNHFEPIVEYEHKNYDRLKRLTFWSPIITWPVKDPCKIVKFNCEPGY